MVASHQPLLDAGGGFLETLIRIARSAHLKEILNYLASLAVHNNITILCQSLMLRYFQPDIHKY